MHSFASTRLLWLDQTGAVTSGRLGATQQSKTGIQHTAYKLRSYDIRHILSLTANTVTEVLAAVYTFTPGSLGSGRPV